MAIMLATAEIQLQLKKIIQYFVFEETTKEKYISLFNSMPDDDNMDEYAKKHEEETDDFIHKLARMTKGEREQSMEMVNSANKNIIVTFMIRLFTIDQYFAEHPNKQLIISEEIPQFLVDCLINYWRLYQHNGVVNYLDK